MKKYDLSEIKRFLKNFRNDNDIKQIFNSRNTVGDPMQTIYNKDGVQIDFCYKYGYLEVFGLDAWDFAEIEVMIVRGI